MDPACPAKPCLLPIFNRQPMGAHTVLWWNHLRKCPGEGRKKGMDHILQLPPAWATLVQWRLMAHHQCGKVQLCGHLGWRHCPNDGPCLRKHLLLPHPRPQAWHQAESQQWGHQFVFPLSNGFGRWCCCQTGLVQQGRFRRKVLSVVCQCPWPSGQACRWRTTWISLCYHSIQPA